MRAMILSIWTPLTNVPAARWSSSAFSAAPVQIVDLHPLPQQVDSLLQHRADARIASGFDKFLGEAVLFVSQRD
jgi:hypothetical protein